MLEISGIKEKELIKMGLKPRKLNSYEKLCNLSKKLLLIPINKKTEEKLQGAIDFSHLNVSPKSVFNVSIFLTLIFLLFSILSGILHFFPIYLTLIFIFGSFGIGYYFYNYPFQYARKYKIEASSEMVLAIVYMTVSMKVKSNLESAIIFAASNLKGSLSIDLTELIWDIYNGKYYSADQALDDFIKKWRMENEEFTQALNLIKSSFYENMNERENVLNEAVKTILEGTKNRMKHYSQDLKSSLTILNAVGILLPIIGLIFFPMVTIFMPETIKPLFIAIGYDIILPMIVFFLITSSLRRRPTTFHQPELSVDGGNRIKKRINFKSFISILTAIFFCGIGFYGISTARENFSFSLILYSLLILFGIASGIVSYSFLTSIPKLGRKDEIISMENELHLVLFQLGYQLRNGASIESNVSKIRTKINELKISKFFGIIINNIQMLGMNFWQALFDEKSGAIYRYPSRLIKAIFKAIYEISKSGSRFLSSSMISISNYLKNMRDVEEYLKEMLSDVVSTMRIQSLILSPLTSGIVVALTAMMMNMLVNLSGWVESFQSQLGGYGPIGDIGGGVFNSIATIDQIIPISYFQIIVGIYMIEIVSMISVFLSKIEYGDEKIQRNYDLGKTLLVAFVIYSFVVIVLYLLLTSIITMAWV
ncbi:MAG: hypothetical protein ACTSYF_11705 [Promethearchaeota archaeon]